MKRNKIGTSSRAMRQRTGASGKPDGDSKYARKFKSGNSMYCKRGSYVVTSETREGINVPTLEQDT